MNTIVPSALALATAFAVISSSVFAQNWSGPYIGGSIGYGKLSEDKSERLLFDTNRDGNYSDTVNTAANADAFAPGFCGGAPNGNNAGAGCQDDDNSTDLAVKLGYDWQSGNMVYGIVGEISKPDLTDNVTGFSSTPAAYTFTREVNSLYALRGRLGYAVNDYLVYGTAGMAWGDIERSFSTTNTANSFTPQGGDDAKGYQLGLGAEKVVMGNWAVGVEYLYTRLDDEGYSTAVGPGTAGPTNPFLIVNPAGTDMKRGEDKFANHAVRVGVSYRFGG